MMPRILKSIVISFSIVLLFSCGSEEKIETQNKSDIIIDEDFDSNELRWIEESTTYHNIEYSGGKYHIDAKDSTSQTSVAPFNSTYLNDLKENFTVTLNLDLLERDIDIQSRAGIIIACASMDYRVFITNKSEIIVTEKLYAENNEMILLSKPLIGDLSKSVQEVIIVIKGYKGEIHYKGKKVGDFKLKSKAIESFRIFTSSQTSIDIYKFKIEND